MISFFKKVILSTFCLYCYYTTLYLKIQPIKSKKLCSLTKCLPQKNKEGRMFFTIMKGSFQDRPQNQPRFIFGTRRRKKENYRKRRTFLHFRWFCDGSLFRSTLLLSSCLSSISLFTRAFTPFGSSTRSSSRIGNVAMSSSLPFWGNQQANDHPGSPLSILHLRYGAVAMIPTLTTSHFGRPLSN